MSIAFPDIETAVSATVQPVELYVRIGGEVVAATEATVRHGVDQPVGTCTVIIEAPRPASVAINAEVEIEMGYPGAVRRVFHGFIPNDESITDDRGRWVSIDGRGWASWLGEQEYSGVEITGPASLKDVFRSLCEMRSIPAHLADDTTYPDGTTTIMLGGNEQINAGHIRFANTTDPLSWLTRNAEMFGYRAFDSPDGTFRLARVSGLPPDPETIGDTTTNLFIAGDRGSVKPATLTLREGPGTTFPIVKTMVAGDRVTILSGPTINNSGQTNNYWYEVRTDAGEVGYTGVGGAVLNLYPVTTNVSHFQEGINCFSLEKRRDTRQMGTYIEVIGARYSAIDGGAVQIRSIPAEVPNEPALEPQGYRHLRIASQDIVTDVQAAGVRNVFEIDRSEVQEFVTWETVGYPHLQPGDVVMVTGLSHELYAKPLWLMKIDQSVSDRGYMATMTGWFGAGEALAAGNDCRTEPVTIPPDGVLHMGDQTIAYYKDPTADGKEVTINFTVTADDYSSLRLAGRCHGTNSILENTAITGSKIEIWQRPNPSLPSGPTNEIRRAGSVELPTANEESRKRRNYSSSNQFWQSFNLPISGNLKAGAAEFRVIAGEHKNPNGFDDFEIKDLELTYCGVGIPTLPGSM